MKAIAVNSVTIAQNIRKNKKNQVLREISERDPISRSELCEITGLNMAAISRLTQELIRENLIHEVGVSPSRDDELGRRRILLSINKSAKHVIGLDVGSSELKAAVFNLKSEIVASTSMPASMTKDPQKYIQHLVQCIHEVIEKAQLDIKAIDLAAVAVPGSISPDNRQLVTTCNIPAFNKMQLQKPLQTALGIPVKLTSIMTAWSLAEYEYAKQHGDVQDMLLVGVGYGIATAPLIDRKVLFSRQIFENAKIDFGHITHRMGGPECHCGRKGCIEAYSGGWAIERDGQAAASKLMLEQAGGDRHKINTAHVFQAAQKGDTDAVRIIRKASRILGRWLPVFIQYYRPACVVFGGRLVLENSLYLDSTIQEIARHLPEKDFRSITFQTTPLGKFSAAYGAAKLRIHELLNEKVEGFYEITY